MSVFFEKQQFIFKRNNVMNFTCDHRCPIFEAEKKRNVNLNQLVLSKKFFVR